jgi:hypothetical protein
MPKRGPRRGASSEYSTLILNLPAITRMHTDNNRCPDVCASDSSQDSFDGNDRDPPDANRTVTIVAGKEKVRVECLQAPLIRSSLFFRRRLAPDDSDDSLQEVDPGDPDFSQEDYDPDSWQQLQLGQTLVRLPKISARYFRLYQHWAYHSKLDYTAFGYSTDGPKFRQWLEVYDKGPEETRQDELVIESRIELEIERSSSYAHCLICLWIHARFLEDIGLQNAIMDELVQWWLAQKFVVLISERTLDLVDKHTRAHFPLRRLCIDWATGRGRKTIASRISSGKFKTMGLPSWLPYGTMLPKEPVVHEYSSVDSLKRRYHVRQVDEAWTSSAYVSQCHHCHGCGPASEIERTSVH